MATHPVFISYARKTSREHAEALHRELGGADGLAFLDFKDIEPLDNFPTEIAEALLGARVVVIFADENYFARQYCQSEFDAAMAPHSLIRSNAQPKDEDSALLHLVVAMPEALSRHVTDRLPSSLRLTQWPRAADTKRLVEVVRKRLEGATLSLWEDLIRIGGHSEAQQVRRRLLEQALPPPANLRGMTLFPTQMERSLDEGFRGRTEDLRRLHHELLSVSADDAPRSVAIEGGAGFGKTRLALEYFHRFGPVYYRGGLFWLDANVGGEELEPRFHGILRAIKPETPDLKTFRDSNRNARDELATALQQLPRETGVLFVVDNIPEPSSDDPPRGLREWCPGAGVVTVLSTSRTIASLQGTDVRPLNLDVLSPEAAVDLLTYGNQRVALGDEQWRLIAEWVGRLPLALELLQSAMHGAISPRELFQLAKENRGTTDELDRLMEALRGEVRAGELRGVTEAFNKSYDLLPEPAQEAARLLACLAPEPIPLDVLKAMGNEPSSGAGRAALINRSFITPPQTISGVALSFEIFGQMHKLLADFVRAKSLDLVADLRRAAKALVDVMSPNSCRNPAEWPLMNASLPHAQAMFERLREAGRGKQEAELTVDVGLEIGILHEEQGAAEKARKIEEQTLELASKHLGPEDTRTLITMNNLAGVFLAQSDLARARTLQERVLTVRTRIFGAEHLDTITAASNLAGTIRTQGDIESARKLQERVLAARTRILGGEHVDTLISMHNLASTLREQGEIDGARKLQERVLAARTRILGGNHLDTLTSMNNLAETLRALGDLEGARKLQKQALDTRVRILGGNHPDTLVSMNNLASTLREQGAVEGARKLQQQVLDAFTRIAGVTHPDTLISMSNLASTLSDLGDIEGARKLQEHVLDAFARILGREHAKTLTAMNNLAGTLRALGDLDGARKLQEQVLETRIRISGRDNPDTLISMNNLAAIFSGLGDLETARRLEEQVLDSHTRILGGEHPNTTISAWNLFLTLRAQGNTEQANTILEQNLTWLLEHDPYTLSHRQRQVRESLENVLDKPR